ncbi:MAG TPA: hypothetical protein VF666_18375 [Pyrinomonadaceae bacterium]|jgi:hypothetical protein
MARQTSVDETGGAMPSFERNRYFYGKPMTVRDFETEQRYLIGKNSFLNRQLHGAGIICGLEVAVPDNFDVDKPAVNLTEGAALDCCGNLIVASRSGKAEIKGLMREGLNYLYIEYAECVRQPIMASANVSSCEEVCCYNRVLETFELSVSTDAPTKTLPPHKQATATIASPPQPSPPDADTLCHRLTQNYFNEHLRVAPGECNNPKVFLAVIEIKSRVATHRTDETAKYRPVVYNNPMLHDLMCDHFADFDNPHRTNALQVGALRSINEVGNDETNSSRVDNINLVSDGTIDIDPDQTLKKITLKTIPATTVTSVTAEKSVGSMNSFAREDHAHNLRINDIAPDEQGQISFTAGANISITKRGANQLEFSSTAIVPTSSAGTKTTTGLVVFDDVGFQEERTSTYIRHGAGDGYVAIVLARQFARTDNAQMYTGDFKEFFDAQPVLMALSTPTSPDFRIKLKDRRRAPESPPHQQNYYVRWWAIATDGDDVVQSTLIVRKLEDIDRQGGVKPPPDEERRLIDEAQYQLMRNPGQTIETLAGALLIDPPRLQPRLDSLVRDGIIRLLNGRYFQV